MLPSFDPDRICNPHITQGAYKQGLGYALAPMARFMTPKQAKALLEHKLRLFDSHAAESSYIQAAVELTVCAYFARHFPQGFEYEPCLNLDSQKDVDCAVVLDGFRFNIEVKCQDGARRRLDDMTSGLRFNTYGRESDGGSLFTRLSTDLAQVPDAPQLSRKFRADLKLKDFLQSAHSKLPEDFDPTTLNILVVCADGPDDFLDWQGFLLGSQGFFTASSFTSRETFSRVDAVLLTNLYHRHQGVAAKDKLTNHWDLASSFNVLFPNPSSLGKYPLMRGFGGMLPCFNDTLFAYRVPGIPDGDQSQNIPFLVAEQFKRGIYYFQPRAVTDDPED